MGYRFDVPLHTNGYHFGFRGLGVLGSTIPSTGEDGQPGFGYPSVAASDLSAALRFQVTRRPAGGEFFVYEDSSFTYTGPSDSFDFVKWKNGVQDGTGTATLNMGVVLVSADFPQTYAILSTTNPALVADFPQSYAILPADSGDITPPLMQGSITLDLRTYDTLGFSVQPAYDATGVAGYEYSMDGGASYVQVGTATNAVVGGLPPSTSYELRFRAYDAAGNRSEPLALLATTDEEPLPVKPSAVPAPTLSSRTITWLKDAMARWSHRDNLGLMMDDFIMLAEKRINGDLDARLQVAATTINTIRKLDVVLIPADVAEIRALSIPDIGALSYLSPEAYANKLTEGARGMPRFFTVLGSYINLYPTPDAVYAMACAYQRKIPSLLDAEDGSNWLIRDHADIYLSACMIEVILYTKNFAEQETWENKYRDAVASLNQTDWNSAASLCIRPDTRTV